MKRTIGLMSVVAIAMVLMIAFSGVASAASWLTEYTPEKQNVNTLIGYARTEIGDQGFDLWKSSSTSNFGLFEEMNAYGKLLATDLQATTSAEVGMTNNPFLNCKNDPPVYEGNIATAMIAGLSVYVTDGSRLSYEERSTASGSFQLYKERSYTSEFTTP